MSAAEHEPEEEDAADEEREEINRTAAAAITSAPADDGEQEEVDRGLEDRVEERPDAAEERARTFASQLRLGQRHEELPARPEIADVLADGEAWSVTGHRRP
ncbi:MAG: hypothetical protein U5K30_01910 [Acidimicrobiales bacterium]|nr:hypothetical protein [Acidimicrobiales bacterium]